MKIKNQTSHIVSLTDFGHNKNKQISSAHSTPLQFVESPSNPMPYIFIKNGKMNERVNYSDILYLQARGSYCEINTTIRKYTLSMSLSKVLIQIDYSLLLRCHRSYAVNRDRISAYNDGNVQVEFDGQRHLLPLSISYRKEVMGNLRKLKS